MLAFAMSHEPDPPDRLFPIALRSGLEIPTGCGFGPCRGALQVQANTMFFWAVKSNGSSLIRYLLQPQKAMVFCGAAR
jgi:hypothetical protein